MALVPNVNRLFKSLSPAWTKISRNTLSSIAVNMGLMTISREVLVDVSPILLAGIASVVVGCTYIVYYRVFHPLARYPGPFFASLTNLWKLYHQWTLRMPETLRELHERYGEVVRVGPNDLSFNNPEAVPVIYKGGRSLPKTAFYDGFTTFNPNLFGTQDEEVDLPPPSSSLERTSQVISHSVPDPRPSSTSDGAWFLAPIGQGDGVVYR